MRGRLARIVLGRAVMALVIAFGVSRALAGDAAAAAGQDNRLAAPRAPFDLGEYIVTATKVKQPLKDSTSCASVIDEKEIEASNADYVMDVIDPLPGVYVRRDGIFGRQSIELRGLGDNCRRIQILVDGRPEKMSLFGCTITQTLPLANVERIEVLRGPESVLSGTDAMGGVVNILTKRRDEPGYEGSLLTSYGSHGTFHTQVGQGGKIGGLDYYATYDHKQTNGHRANSAYEADFGSLRLGYQFDEVWRLEWAGQYFEDEGEDPGPRNAPYTNDDQREYKRWSWNAALLGNWDRAELSLTVYDNAGHHRFDMPTINDYWHSKDRTTGVQTKLALTVYEADDVKDVVTVGHEYYYQWAEPQDSWIAHVRATTPPGPLRFYDFGPYGRVNHDLFAHNELTVGRWVNSLGVRAHYDNRAEEWEGIPQVGLLCHITKDTTARARVAKGFRQPAFSELHLFPAHREDLEPEQVWSYEIGLTHALFPWLSLSATPFYMDVKNMVQAVRNPAPPPNMLNQNSGEFNIRGVETGVDIRAFQRLHLAVYYTVTDIEDPSGTGHANRQGKPEHVVDAVLSYTWRNLTVSMDCKYVAGLYDSNLLAGGTVEKVDDFFVANLKATCNVHKNVQVFAGIENVFDKDYEEFPGYTMPGIGVFGGMKVGF